MPWNIVLSDKIAKKFGTKAGKYDTGHHMPLCKCNIHGSYFSERYNCYYNFFGDDSPIYYLIIVNLGKEKGNNQKKVKNPSMKHKCFILYKIITGDFVDKSIFKKCTKLILLKMFKDSVSDHEMIFNKKFTSYSSEASCDDVVTPLAYTVSVSDLRTTCFLFKNGAKTISVPPRLTLKVMLLHKFSYKSSECFSLIKKFIQFIKNEALSDEIIGGLFFYTIHFIVEHALVQNSPGVNGLSDQYRQMLRELISEFRKEHQSEDENSTVVYKSSEVIKLLGLNAKCVNDFNEAKFSYEKAESLLKGLQNSFPWYDKKMNLPFVYYFTFYSILADRFTEMRPGDANAILDTRLTRVCDFYLKKLSKREEKMHKKRNVVSSKLSSAVLDGSEGTRLSRFFSCFSK